MIGFKLTVKEARRRLAYPFPDRIGSVLFRIELGRQGIPSGNLEQAC